MARAAYVHVPFCAHRCGYCNFALVAGRGDLVPSFLQAVEIELQQQLTEPQEVDTLYYGGGTPTQLGTTGLQTLTQLTTHWHPRATGYEWTVEANPADMGPEMADVLATAGVNRLSLGAQSFRAEKLRILERDHAARDIERSVELARQRGLAVSIDLIFAAPGETLAEWLDDLQRAIELGPQHISVYGLTFEKGTTYWSRRSRGDLVQAEDDLERDMYVAAIEGLAAAGFEHYEVSNFAQPGCRSRHNETYWRGDEYYAVGPGAAGYVDGVREANHRSTTTYLQRVLARESAVAEREQLDDESRARERLVFALRRLEGLRRDEFQQSTGFTMDKLAGEALAKFASYGLLADDGERVQLTREGLLVSDAMWPELL